MTADEVIAGLGLEPHPEGGHYRETFRAPPAADGARSPVTLIYFLLAEGEVSRWHRVDASEIWLWHAGAPLQLDIASAEGVASTHKLGCDLAASESPQAVVPKDAWQRAQSCGAWTLVSCTVAPGFTFDGFELAPDSYCPPGFSTKNHDPKQNR